MKQNYQRLITLRCLANHRDCSCIFVNFNYVFIEGQRPSLTVFLRDIMTLITVLIAGKTSIDLGTGSDCVSIANPNICIQHVFFFCKWGFAVVFATLHVIHVNRGTNGRINVRNHLNFLWCSAVICVLKWELISGHNPFLSDYFQLKNHS